MSDLFRQLRATARSPSRNLFRHERERTDGATWSAIAFFQDHDPVFLRPPPPGETDRTCGYLLLVEHRQHLSNHVVAACIREYATSPTKDRTMVVHGAAGGVGSALIELGRLAGANLIGIASSEVKCALVRSLGATAIRRGEASVDDAVMAATQGRGADLICNHMAGDSFASDLKMVASFGMIVSYGALCGMPEQDLFRDMRANVGRCPAVRCFTMHAFDHMPALRDRCTEKVLQLFAENKVAPVLGPILPLAEAAQAHRLLEQRAVMGKILLKPENTPAVPVATAGMLC